MKEIKSPKELLDFMNKNIDYGYLSKSGKVYHSGDKDFDLNWYNEYILETKEDILNNSCGTCFDQVEFEREWFLKHNYEIKTFYQMVVLDYENSYPTHSFLAFKDNNKWYWFENSFKENRGIYEFNSIDELIEFEYNKYLELLKKYNISDEEINKIIITEFDKPKERISAKEYIDHALNSKKIER